MGSFFCICCERVGFIPTVCECIDMMRSSSSRVGPPCVGKNSRLRNVDRSLELSILIIAECKGVNT